MGWFKREPQTKRDTEKMDAETAALLSKTENAVARLEKTAERLDALVESLGHYVAPPEETTRA